MRTESPERRGRGNLHKRRASSSPHKFIGSRIDPPQIHTGLASSTTRGRTEIKVEAYHDPIDKIKAEDLTTTDGVLQQPAKPNNNNHADGTAIARQQPPIKRNAGRRQQPFRLLEAFAADSALIITLTSYLDVPSIISLYAISKSFHLHFNRHATAYILSAMRTLAPGADKIFPWRCYRSLCIKDPIKRQKAIRQTFQADVGRLGDISRDVPSLRWLQMVVWREAIVTDMLVHLNAKALRTPPGTRDAVKRMWFALDLPLSAHRLALIRSTTYFPDKAIELSVHFLVKCDMAFTDPGFDFYHPNQPNQPNQPVVPHNWVFGAPIGCNLRETLTAERNFTPLWRVLKGWTWDSDEPPRPLTRPDLVKLRTRHTFKWPANTPDAILKQPVMGMRYSDFCFTGCERVYRADDDELTKMRRPRQPLLTLDALLLGECVRRDIDITDQLLEMMAWGFIRPNGRNVPVLTVEEQRKRMRMPVGTRHGAKFGKAELSEFVEMIQDMGGSDLGKTDDDATSVGSKMEID